MKTRGTGKNECIEFPATRDMKILAHSAVCKAARLLNLTRKERPTVRWYALRKFGAVHPLGQFMFSDPDSIWINACIPEEKILSVVSHEMQHYADHLHGVVPTEERASEFAAQATELPWSPPIIVCDQKQKPGVVYPGSNAEPVASDQSIPYHSSSHQIIH